MASVNCPSVDTLKSFALGDLPAADWEQVAAHVASCAKCDGLLEELDQHTDGLVSALTVINAAATAGSASQAVPDMLLDVARSAATLNGADRLEDIGVDPGRRLARLLAEGPCRLGRFELLSELGVGSFGYVFKARDTELDRTVALKVQRAGSFASDEEVERFLREARAAAQLKHPRIVAIHNTERTEDGVCFLVTEYIEGETLEALLSRQSQAEGSQSDQQHRESADLVAKLADALDFAHQHRVVHRDMKPSNVLIDRAGEPHIMDFGLAKHDTGDTMTSAGRVMGTPAYMSPEQAQGDAHNVDARTDIYSLGVILYEMLTGERPFLGNRRMLLLQVIEDEPRPPRQLNDRIPRDLETICLKAMAKSPLRRYQTAAELAEDLRRFLRGEPIKARAVGYPERLWRWCRRYPLAASLFVAVTLGSIASLAYLSRLSTDFVHATALESASMEADMLEQINRYYSEEVLGRLDWKKTKVTHQYASTPQSLPLPFTFMIDASHRITENKSGMEVRMYSDFPWRKQGGPRDTFEQQALRVLRQREPRETDDRSYYEFTQVGGRPVLRYARAQLMKENCVKCHNQHKESPKKDWKSGDVGGVLAITRPLERDIEQTRDGLRGAYIMMGIIAGVFALFLFGLLWATRNGSRVKVS